MYLTILMMIYEQEKLLDSALLKVDEDELEEGSDDEAKDGSYMDKLRFNAYLHHQYDNLVSR